MGDEVRRVGIGNVFCDDLHSPISQRQRVLVQSKRVIQNFHRRAPTSVDPP
jgi:hypothetical protein